MQQRFTNHHVLSGPIQALLSLSSHLERSSIEKQLIELVELRVSQINGCTFCMAMHTKALLDGGERADRLAVLPGWRDAGWFSDRERAALAWAEAVTVLEHNEVSDAVYTHARSQFSETELADLTLATIVINGWNRLNVAYRNPPTAFTIEAAEAVAAV